VEEIIIDIDEQGNVRIEGQGIVGPDCKTLTADIEAALGDVTQTVQKPEYRQTRATPRKAVR
jgi:hypothetical protein